MSEDSVATLAVPTTATTSAAVDQSSDALASPPKRRDSILQSLLFWSVLFIVLSTTAVAGLLLRQYAWDQTEPIRFTDDINNAFAQGTQAQLVGYFNRYDQNKNDPQWWRGNTPMELDYAPGRMAIATLWARWVHVQVDGPISADDVYPHWQGRFYDRARALADHYQTELAAFQKDNPTDPATRQIRQAQLAKDARLNPYRLCFPMLCINLTGETLSAVAIAILVARYTRARNQTLRRTLLAAHVYGVVLAAAVCIASLCWFAWCGWPLKFAWPWSLLAWAWLVFPDRRSILSGVVAALFFWFNPAVISNAHTWPQWDSWVLPFFLWGLVSASFDFWFIAGFIVATGAMFKGQILFGAGFFILWPVFQGRFLAIVRFLIGMATAVAVETSPWLLRTPGAYARQHFVPGHLSAPAIAWVTGVAVVFLLLPLLRWRWAWYAKLPVVLAMFVAVMWPCAQFNAMTCLCAAIIPAGTGLIVMDVPRKAIPYIGAAWVSAALLLCINLFGGSKTWFDTGFASPTTHFESMASGANDNLADILNHTWGWETMDPAITLPAGSLANTVDAVLSSVDKKYQRAPDEPVSVPLKYVLVSSWITALILSAMGAAFHDWRKSPGFLFAIAAPWIVLFAVMAQMHQRYLLWGAGLGAPSAAINPGYAVLNVLLSVIAMSQELDSMLGNRPDLAHGPFARWIQGWHPGIGWVVILIGVIYVYSALKPWTSKAAVLEPNGRK